MNRPPKQKKVVAKISALKCNLEEESSITPVIDEIDKLAIEYSKNLRKKTPAFYGDQIQW